MSSAIFLIIAAGVIIYLIYKRSTSEGNVDIYAKSFEDNMHTDEVGDGFEFEADLTPYTSLEALNYHRVKIRGTPEHKLPHFGDNFRNHGFWLPIFDGYDDEKAPSKIELRTLEFLKKFRKVYESNLSHEEKEKTISELVQEYKDLSLSSRVACWYLWELTEIPGISESIAALLYFEGIKTNKDVEMASGKELLKIPGIGPGRLKQIRTHFIMQSKISN